MALEPSQGRENFFKQADVPYDVVRHMALLDAASAKVNSATCMEGSRRIVGVRRKCGGGQEGGGVVQRHGWRRAGARRASGRWESSGALRGWWGAQKCTWHRVGDRRASGVLRVAPWCVMQWREAGGRCGHEHVGKGMRPLRVRSQAWWVGGGGGCVGAKGVGVHVRMSANGCQANGGWMCGCRHRRYRVVMAATGGVARVQAWWLQQMDEGSGRAGSAARGVERAFACSASGSCFVAGAGAGAAAGGGGGGVPQEGGRRWP
ncbi:hypothetical protein K439DRAFT_1531095 [Ramaria rubella]|nr:hypothetical protein K439DRAFT_1531095 [Ramaria rubella]